MTSTPGSDGQLSFDLDGRRVLVTGGGTGIGRTVALALARAGADVAVTFRTHDGESVADEIRALGRRSAAFALDATDEHKVRDVVARAADALGGPVDTLVNNAGGLVGRVAIGEMSLDHWRAVMDVNVTSAFLVTREVMATMPDGGRIVMLGSIAGETGGSTGSAAYAASKTALEGLTRGLARELAPRGTTVNLVAPGYITDTPFHETFSTPAKRAATVESIPLGRAGYPDDVAAAVRWLVSPAASFVTGTMTHVNGGAWF
ncbi:SDR family NAD(P)-dependent oxidoreductase [Sanguibacter massiliensis]|uniref:SDR family NAD(P)-dependent oxidoreductase n=1 Tax=Sanguibacter massiliensis TaxID=1973217 RepID=UPI000C85EB66|nr:SDR family NAD(P)-dependent oxidoreductase [Sanguibacter massiliensis]